MIIARNYNLFSSSYQVASLLLSTTITFLFSLFAYQSTAFADIYRLEIKEASCPLCTIELVQKFSSLKGVVDVTIEPQTQTVVVKLYGDMTLPEETIKQKVKEANLTLQSIKHEKSQK